ncbi:MAG: hypothetical protein R2882_05520 [Gemmatimonadales bacterium]
MKQLGAALAVLALLGSAACQENINSPGECPDLCPGEQIQVRDTIIPAVVGGDSTYFGFITRATLNALFVSDSLAAGEYRSFVVFPAHRSDSVDIDGVMLPLTVDTVSVTFNLLRRDSTATGLTIYLHRIPITTDTTVTFSDVEDLIALGEPLDSIVVPDSVQSGPVSALIADSNLIKLETPEDDSGAIAFALTVRASKPTGVLLSVDANNSATAPSFAHIGRIEIADTTRRRQTVTVRPDDFGKYGWVTNVTRTENADPDLLYLGGPTGARVLLRFELPSFIRDSGQILRATLELTPAGTLNGLPNTQFGDSIAASGIVVDLGAKSPPLVNIGLLAAGGITLGTADVVSLDFFRLATQWQISGGPPSVLYLTSGEESFGGGFLQPIFHSTRSGADAPRIRLTYGLPTRPGRP